MVISRVKEHMERRGLGVRELARLAGVSPDTVRRAIDNASFATLTLATLERLAGALGLFVSSLFREW